MTKVDVLKDRVKKELFVKGVSSFMDQLKPIKESESRLEVSSIKEEVTAEEQKSDSISEIELPQ